MAAGAAADEVTDDEIAHPRRLVDQTLDGSGFVAIALLALALFGLVVLLLEALIEAVVATTVFVVRSIWGRWYCEVEASGGERRNFLATSLTEANALRQRLVDALEYGTPFGDLQG